MTDNIEVFTQSSIRIGDNGRNIYLDPFQMNRAPHDAGFIFVTHDHYDHFSPEDIAKVSGENTVLIVPERMAAKAKGAESYVNRIETVRPNEAYEIDGLRFETVPSYNIAKAFHPRSAEWVGYLLTIGGKRIYVAGDTDATAEAKAVKCDIAMVPIGGTYTMDPGEAAELVNAIGPEVAIPTHYGSIVGKKKDAELFAGGVRKEIRVEIKMI